MQPGKRLRRSPRLKPVDQRAVLNLAGYDEIPQRALRTPLAIRFSSAMLRANGRPEPCFGGNNMNWRMVGILVGVVLIGGAVAADVMLLWP
jgi:hypothetical protein